MSAEALNARHGETDKSCPHCRTDVWVKTSRFRWYDLLFLAVGMRPHRCHICYRRFYAGDTKLWARDRKKIA